MGTAVLMNKYRAKKIETQDGVFDSKKEYNRWLILKTMERSGHIQDLRRQVEYLLIPKQRNADGKAVREVKYIADFTYNRQGETVVEDVKGYKGGGAYAVFTIKKKLMLYKYGITIKEV